MIISGYRTRSNVLGQLKYTCDKCQQRTYHTFVRTRRSFTVFWVPLFPIAKVTTTRCHVCGFQTYFDNKKADEYFPQANKKATPTTPERP
jgi:ribosomal protein L37E